MVCTFGMEPDVIEDSIVMLDRAYIVHVGYGPLKQWHAHLANGISLNFQSKKYSWECTSMSTKHLSMNKIHKI